MHLLLKNQLITLFLVKNYILRTREPVEIQQLLVVFNTFSSGFVIQIQALHSITQFT